MTKLISLICIKINKNSNELIILELLLNFSIVKT